MAMASLDTLKELSAADFKELINYKAFSDEIVKQVAKDMVMPRYMIDPAHTHSVVGAGGANSQAGANHTHQYTPHPSSVIPARWSDGNLYHMLATRLGWGTTQGECPYKKVICTRVTDERVVVFIQTKDDVVLIDDGAFLYPSDALITQLRILQE